MSSLAGAIVPPLILGFVGLILLPGKQKSTYNVRDTFKEKRKAAQRSQINRYFTVFSEAETNRRAGNHQQAVKKYHQAIEIGESTQQWQKFGPPSLPYKGLARIYYHQQQDQQAIQVLNRYMKLAAQHDLGSKDIEKFKQKINQNTIKRFTIKYSS